MKRIGSFSSQRKLYQLIFGRDTTFLLNALIDRNMNKNMQVPVFRISQYRKEEVLIYEPANYVNKTRIFMVIVSLALGLLTLSYLVLQIKKYFSTFKPSFFYKYFIPCVLLSNILLHTTHYAHNIYDPVAYFEPRKLYKKRIFAEMEITFLFNFPASALFIEVIRRMTIFCTKNQPALWTTMIVACIYSLMSLISGAHYTYEPVTNFKTLPNITISGEAVTALILFFSTLISHLVNMDRNSMNPYRLLKNRKDRAKRTKILNKKSIDIPRLRDI